MTSNLSEFATRLRREIRNSNQESAHRYRDGAFNELAQELFRYQFGQNAAYRRFCEHRGILPKHIQHWTDIPALPTTAFKDTDATSLKREEWEVTFESSGTTATHRSRHRHSRESLALYEASALAWFTKSVLAHPGEQFRVLSLTPSISAAPHSSLVHMFELIRREHGNDGSIFAGLVSSNDSWLLDVPAVISALSLPVREHCPMLILGTAFSVVQLLDEFVATDLQFKLPQGSTIIETGGYKGRSRSIPKEQLFRMLADTFGVETGQIITEYGMSELSSQAYCRHDTSAEQGALFFQFPPWARVQVISPENGKPVSDGQTGLLRVFDLANVWSVMAIQTEDLAIQRRSGFELLGRALEVPPRGCSLMPA
jgi:hypothetical protein